MPAGIRKAMLWGHLAGSIVIGVYLYSPWGSESLFQAAVLFGVFPAMAVSGLVMWQWGRINRIFRSR